MFGGKKRMRRGLTMIERSCIHRHWLPVFLIALSLAIASCASSAPPTDRADASTDMLQWINDYIFPASLFFTVSEFEDISSGSPLYYYYHTITKSNSTMLIVDKYIPFKRVIERSAQDISDKRLALLKTAYYYLDELGGFDVVQFSVSQTGPFETTLSSRDIAIPNFGSFEFLDISSSNESASVSTIEIGGDMKDVLEISGSGFRSFKRKNSIETVNNYRTHEIYVKNAGLYSYEEQYYYPQREGAIFRGKIGVEELRMLLTSSHMPFFFNEDL
jgi:hypothetical protein